jgi:uncharacterized protein (TIGR03790 family)
MSAIPRRGILGLLLLNCCWVLNLHGGGSGLNTVVVVNQSSSNSCELGNYYCELRHVPPENVLHINWTGGNTMWTSNDFQTILVTPLLDMLAARQLTNQIDYVVLSMDIPFQTSFSTTLNGTTSALFYGMKPDASDPGITNSYACSETSFHQAKPASAPGFSFLTTMITAETLEAAKQMVNQGAAGDGTFPLQPVILAKTWDPARNIRAAAFDNAVFNVRVRGLSSILRTNINLISGQTGLLGYETGLEQFNLSPGTFIPGALADNMTSFSGVIFDSSSQTNSQTNLLAFINAGASGSYGTVAEPGTDTQKFPDPLDYFYQARGFNLAESYYQSVRVPYLGLTVGEPLSAPFARPGSGSWSASLTNSILLSGSAVLSARFTAANADNPVQQVDLFVDGKYFSTVTNVTPCPGNQLTVMLNGFPVAYTVGTNSAPGTIAAELAALINDTDTTNATRVQAFAHGDRIELQSFATNLMAQPYYILDNRTTNSPAATYNITYLPDWFPPRTVTAGVGRSGIFGMEVEIPTAMHYVIEASTNLFNWVPIFTNTRPGLLDFHDLDSTNYPTRFYRVVGPIPGSRPEISMPQWVSGGALQMHLASQPGQPCAILASPNLMDWTPIFTNQAGGAMDFVDLSITNVSAQFYRAWLVPPSPPVFTVLSGVNGDNVVRVDSAAQPYTVSVSTNSGQWSGFITNFNVGDIQTSTTSEIGDGGQLSTFLTASRPRFLNSEACGIQSYVVLGTSISPGAWAQFRMTTTGGQYIVVGVTNQSNPGMATNLAAQLYAQVNATAALQGSDGVVAEDFNVVGITASFKLRARSRGYDAARTSVQLKSYGVTTGPSSQRTLTQNLSDLQPRNHLYVSAGATDLNVNAPFDTTTLPDGYHELTAVAYAGNHVRTQTRITLPVRIQNSSLTANLNLLDLPATAPVAGTYHLQVTANMTNVNITLFSTGGALNTISNQVPATFTVEGSSLGVGLHPFYAIIEATSGARYRTETHWARLVH